MNAKDMESHTHDHMGSTKLYALNARGMGKSTGLVSSLGGSHQHHMGKHTHQLARFPIPKTIPPELEEGEVVCKECKGCGALPTNEDLRQHTHGNQMIQQNCPTCLGTGKLDWIEAAMGGKPQPDPFAVDSSSFTSAMPSHNHTYSQEYTASFEDMGKEIAEAIDKEILEELSNILKKEDNF